VKTSYQVVSKEDRAKLAEFLAKEGQQLLPLVDLVEQSRLAVDEMVDVMGQAVVEAVLSLSAISVAGERHQGKAGGEVRRHGRQGGVVRLSERKLRVTRPRLRRKGGGEVPVPAYEAMSGSNRLGARMLEILMRGVSTRNYRRVLPEMAATVGVSKSAVSREFVEASAEELRALAERNLKDTDLLVLYIDGLRFGDYLVVVAPPPGPAQGRGRAWTTVADCGHRSAYFPASSPRSFFRAEAAMSPLSPLNGSLITRAMILVRPWGT